MAVCVFQILSLLTTVKSLILRLEIESCPCIGKKKKKKIIDVST